jgi:putative transcriptional regulator
MTKLGEYLSSKSINQTKVANKAGLSKARLNQLMNEPSTRLQADELYRIALTIGVDPCTLLEYVCGHLKKVIK